MKRISLFGFLWLSSIFLSAQWSDYSMNFGGKTRQYRIYVPTSYTGNSSVPLVFTLHGLGDNAGNFSSINMNLVADTANFIIVCPQAFKDPFIGTAWNSRAGFSGYYPSSNINDIGFIGALIDSVSARYQIDHTRIYSCGFSMGGFMTERLACEYNGRFAAFASVAGTFGNGLSSCNPDRAIPVAHFHGTADQTVGYHDNSYGNSADSLVRFWVTNNQLDTSPQVETLPDIASDGYTIDHFTYSSPGKKVVELFRVNNADHVWLTTSNDIDYSTEIWRFFSRHNNLTAGINTYDKGKRLQIFPNPGSGKIHLKNTGFTVPGKILIKTYTGQFVQEIAANTEDVDISIADFSAGSYVLELHRVTDVQVERFVIK